MQEQSKSLDLDDRLALIETRNGPPSREEVDYLRAGISLLLHEVAERWTSVRGRPEFNVDTSAELMEIDSAFRYASTLEATLYWVTAHWTKQADLPEERRRPLRSSAAAE